MYLNFTGLFRNMLLAFRKPTIVRAVTTVLIGSGWTIVRIFNGCALWLDYLVFPAFRQTRIEKPVFVFANPRSGTTLFHRLLSMDTERFATVKLYQTIFPSVLSTRFFESLQG